MPFEFKENTGSLFPRIDKENDRQPDATGRAKIDGQMFKIAAWNRESSSGIEYSSLVFTLESASKPKEGPEPPKQAKLDYDDNIPF